MPNADKQYSGFARAVTRLIGDAQRYWRDKTDASRRTLSHAECDVLARFERAARAGAREGKAMRDTMAERQTHARRLRASLVLRCEWLHHDRNEHHLPGADCPALARASAALDFICGDAKTPALR